MSRLDVPTDMRIYVEEGGEAIPSKQTNNQPNPSIKQANNRTILQAINRANDRSKAKRHEAKQSKAQRSKARTSSRWTLWYQLSRCGRLRNYNIPRTMVQEAQKCRGPSGAIQVRQGQSMELHWLASFAAGSLWSQER